MFVSIYWFWNWKKIWHKLEIFVGYHKRCHSCSIHCQMYEFFYHWDIIHMYFFPNEKKTGKKWKWLYEFFENKFWNENYVVCQFYLKSFQICHFCRKKFAKVSKKLSLNMMKIANFLFWFKISLKNINKIMSISDASIDFP